MNKPKKNSYFKWPGKWGSLERQLPFLQNSNETVDNYCNSPFIANPN
jgi:hypothetical protein